MPKNRPIRHINPIVDRVLEALSPTFTGMYAQIGRSSIPAEHLLKGGPLIARFYVPSERQFCERLQHNLLLSGSSIYTSGTRPSIRPTLSLASTDGLYCPHATAARSEAFDKTLRRDHRS